MKKRFKKVYVEITNVCNLSCNFCPKTERTKKFITVEEFRHVLSEIRPYTDYIYLHLMGEPLLHPQLEELLEVAASLEFKVNITTNGTLLLNQRDILLHAKALRQINVSLHSFEANEANMTLLEYVTNVLEFIKIAQTTTNIISSVRLWNMDSDDLEGANERNQEILELIETYHPQEISLAKLLMNTKQLKLSERAYLNMAEKFQWPDVSLSNLNSEVFCYGLRDQIGILVDGTVVPCCLDHEGDIPLGNVYQESFHDIITGTRAMSIYEGFSRRQAVEELCKKCHYATTRF